MQKLLSLTRPSSRRTALTVLAAAAIALSACEDDSSAPAPAPTPAPAPAPQPEPEPETASYTFEQPTPLLGPRVPGSLPEGVHFAPPLALVAHAPGEAPWSPGETASDGLKLLAEAGDSSALIAEAEAAGMDILATNLTEFFAIFLSPDPSITLHLERPCVSYAQMIAPSADWFVGVSDGCATDGDGAWQDEMSADVIVYDAGTATGEDFRFKSADTEPREPIMVLDAPPYLPAPTVYLELSATRKTE